MNETELTTLFEEWKTRYDANPESFQDCPAFEAQPPKTYGEGAARYFLLLVEELTADQVK